MVSQHIALFMEVPVQQEPSKGVGFSLNPTGSADEANAEEYHLMTEGRQLRQ